MKAQDAEGSKSHFGTKYAELSMATNGYVGSICDADYSTNMKYFKEQIVRQMKSLPLECNPVGAVAVTLNPAMSVTYSVTNMTLNFDPPLPVGTTVTATYQCPQ
jgi:hypothetical protein